MTPSFKCLCRLVLVFGLVSTAASAGEPRFADVDNAAVEQLIEGGVKIVDVRRPDEWRSTGVIPGSTLLTAFDANGRFNPDFPAAFEALVKPDEGVILICRTGNRSRVLAQALSEQAGYTQVYNVTDGIVGWMEGGNPTVPCGEC